ncbi:MAG: hypothetical protein ABI867_35105 [Kofleriaceae bacterium]
MTKLVLVMGLLAACGNKPSSPPAEPIPSTPSPDPTAPPKPATIGADECMSKGGRVKNDIGDGKVACDPGERDLGRVALGTEGAVCCATGEAAVPAP